MTNAPSSQWVALAPHQGDWMKKSLDAVNLSAKGMAAYLGVEPETVSRWINHKRTPDLRTLRLWAMRTGVPLTYLQTGILPSAPDGGGSRLGESNSGPSHYNVVPLFSFASDEKAA